jgi:hypothetical protein
VSDDGGGTSRAISAVARAVAAVETILSESKPDVLVLVTARWLARYQGKDKHARRRVMMREFVAKVLRQVPTHERRMLGNGRRGKPKGR